MSTRRAAALMSAALGLVLSVAWWLSETPPPSWAYVLRSFLRLVQVVS